MLGIALLGIALACGRDPILVATIESVQDASVKCELSDAGDVADACWVRGMVLFGDDVRFDDRYLRYYRSGPVR